MAAPVSDESASEDETGGEIVVTALKRDSTIQKTPITISAVTGEMLTRAGVTDVTGITQAVPNLVFVDGGSDRTRVVIRGIQSVGEPTVGVYYDETAVTGAVSPGNDAGLSTPRLKLFDVQRVEVLRGPQGTLYGSGSMAGTVRILFNKPTQKLEGAVEAEIGSIDGGSSRHDVQGMINVPIISDVLAARLVLFDANSGGFIDNTRLNRKNTGSAHSQGGRFLVRFTPTDSLTIDASANYQKTRGETGQYFLDGPALKNTLFIQMPSVDKSELYNVTARWDLGPVTATAIASYADRKINNTSGDTSQLLLGNLNNPAVCQRLRGNGSPCSPETQATFNAYVQSTTPAAITPRLDTSGPSAELRLSSNGRQFLDWTVGTYYSKRNGDVTNGATMADPLTGELISPEIYLYKRVVQDKLEQIAFFGEGAAHITSKLTFTGGLRYFKYDRSVGGQTLKGFDLLGINVQPYAITSSSDTGWISKFNAAYQANEKILFYASASQGYRPGGVNQVLGLPPEFAPYEADSLWNYEVGLKTSWFNNRLNFNIDAYRIDWDNMQVAGRTSTGPGFSFISNAGAARAQGIEAEFSARPLQGLSFQANASFSSSKLSEDQVSSAIVAAGRKGNRIPFTPKVTMGASADYTAPIANDLNMTAHVDLNHVGQSYSEFNPTNIFRRNLPAYTLTNVRFGIDNESARWGIYVFANNVFNKVTVSYVIQTAATGGNAYAASAAPRTVGLGVRSKF
ncbi:TonB-dependent receptor [Sphingobium boeckii]|uniref:Outer membrane receptor protein involved in Fe transport n=1 Tax=Sphingobium boeckii TaxID=1082345 RepID=A0A7W9AFP3_9SPHN|nr:TonB-dependent receptor [Sphingobium boeckii]MBB5684779.1 outer membrane receptor protein involved in Fe transport [Sphingobium boeckii]